MIEFCLQRKLKWEEVGAPSQQNYKDFSSFGLAVFRNSSDVSTTKLVKLACTLQKKMKKKIMQLFHHKFIK
jgi:hypothetical protein